VYQLWNLHRQGKLYATLFSSAWHIFQASIIQLAIAPGLTIKANLN
jgi:hypothetical protein